MSNGRVIKGLVENGVQEIGANFQGLLGDKQGGTRTEKHASTPKVEQKRNSYSNLKCFITCEYEVKYI